MDMEDKLHISFLAGTMTGIESVLDVLTNISTASGLKEIPISIIQLTVGNVIEDLNNRICDIPGGADYLEFMRKQNNGE